MSSPHSLINSLLPLSLLIPQVPLLIFYLPYWKLPLPQAFVTLCVLRLETRRPTALGFAKVATKYPVHCLDRTLVLRTVAALVPPVAAFVEESKDVS